MGKSWFGTQPASKPFAGPRVAHRAETDLGITGAAAIALLTSAEGLAQWLATPTRFSAHRGGTLEFMDGEFPGGERNFGGSYALLDIPDHIVLVTELHGEIEVRFAFQQQPGHASVTMTCVAADDREAPVLDARVRATMDRLIRALGGVGIA